MKSDEQKAEAQGAVVQPDFFYDRLPISASPKDDRALMEYPFFSLTKQSRMQPILYKDNGVSIKIEPGPRGIATMWDKDVLIYLATLINQKRDRGETPSSTIIFKASDFLNWAHRGKGKRTYQLLNDALYRLRSTMITTSITSNHERERSGFGWIDNYKLHERTNRSGLRVLQAIEVKLNDWTYRALVHERRILTLNPEYCKIKSSLHRRIYEIARKHCGYQSKWTISLENLHKKCGSTRHISKFKHDLKDIIEGTGVLDYNVTIETRNKLSKVIFRPKKKASLKVSTNDRRPILNTEFLQELGSLYPKHDIWALYKQWQDWSREQSEPVQQPEQAFKGYCARLCA